MKNYRKAKPGDVRCGSCRHVCKPFYAGERYRCYRRLVGGRPWNEVVSQYKTCDLAIPPGQESA